MKKLRVSTQSLAQRRPALARAIPELAPGGQVGEYRVVSCLGSGWEGQVYRVRDGQQRSHVLKLFRDRAVHSAGAWQARLRHLTLVHGARLGSSRPLRVTFRRRAWHGVILPYAPGESLTEWLRRQPSGRFTLARARLAFLAILRELNRVHDRGAYHGDLHEGNIVLTRCGAGYRAFFIDALPQPGAIESLQERDVVEAVRVFAWTLGGWARYPHHPEWVRQILCGLQSRRILSRHCSVTELLESVRKGSAQSVWPRISGR